MDYIILFNDDKEAYYYLLDDGMVYKMEVSSNNNNIDKWSMMGAGFGFFGYIFLPKLIDIQNGNMVFSMIFGCIMGVITVVFLRGKTKSVFVQQNQVDSSIEFVDMLLEKGAQKHKDGKKLWIGMLLFSFISTLILSINDNNILICACIAICWWISVFLLMIERPIVYYLLKKSIKKGKLFKKGRNV